MSSNTAFAQNRINNPSIFIEAKGEKITEFIGWVYDNLVGEWYYSSEEWFCRNFKYRIRIMNNTTKFCIIYAVLSQETSERLNVGLLAFADGKIFYQYSKRKLAALEQLLPKESYAFYERLLKNIDVTTLDISLLDYLKRYSNNLFAISEVKDVQMPYSADTTQWLYRNYVDYVA